MKINFQPGRKLFSLYPITPRTAGSYSNLIHQRFSILDGRLKKLRESYKEKPQLKDYLRSCREVLKEVEKGEKTLMRIAEAEIEVKKQPLAELLTLLFNANILLTRMYRHIRERRVAKLDEFRAGQIQRQIEQRRIDHLLKDLEPFSQTGEDELGEIAEDSEDIKDILRK